MKTFSVIGSPGYPMDEPRFRALVAAAYDRCFHPPGVARQLHAITASGDRTPGACARCDCRPWSSTATATRWFARRPARQPRGRSPAPGCDLIEGMGHDLPAALWPRLVEEIDSNARRARVAA